jgi:hypothetical protein
MVFLNKEKLNLFVKNYYKIISENSIPDNVNDKKILTIVACHTNNLIKYNAVINNIPYLLFPNNDIVIINSSNEEYSDKLKNYVASNFNVNQIVRYVEIPNDKFFDFGKHIHILDIIQSDNSYNKDYDFVVLFNDSVIIKKSISYFYNFIIKMDKELYAYNDSSEIKYHYQSYLYAVKYNAIHKLIEHFKNHKDMINHQNDVISKLELKLNDIYSDSNDCFLKIANLPCNLNKNIYFHNNFLYNLLFSVGILPFIKIRKLNKNL